MVPGRFDIVIDGYGYVTARAVDPNLPFRTQQAALSYTPTFLERTNVGDGYGDNQQDFYLTNSQHDWSGGQGQRFFRVGDPDSARQFYQSSGLDPSIPGQLALGYDFTAASDNKAAAMSVSQTPGVFVYRKTGATASLFTVTPAGTIVDKSDPGAGGQNQWGLCTDGVYTYIAGSTSIRKWDGAAYTTFSATANAGALTFLNNALYSCDGSTLNTYDGTGAKTTLFTWKDATNTALTASAQRPRIIPFGGKLLIFFPQLDRCPKLYIYDGSSTFLVAELPVGTIGYDVFVANGIVYLSGAIFEVPGGMGGGINGAVPIIYYWANGTLGEIWRGLGPIATTISKNLYGMPALASYGGRLVFSSARSIYFFDVSQGAIWLIGTVPLDSSPLSSQAYEIMVGDPSAFLYAESGSAKISLHLYPSTSYVSAGSVTTSWFDFGNALTKNFGGAKVDWSSSNDGTLEIDYSVDDGALSGTLQASAVSGTEYKFPANTIGRKIQLTVTSNKGSTAAPIIKRIYVRAAPVLQSYRVNSFILDLGGAPITHAGSAQNPVRLRDNSDHVLTGEDMRAHLQASIVSQTPLTVTDVTGTYTAVLEPGGCEFDLTRPGQWYAQIKIREI